MNWYYVEQGKQAGPVEDAQLEQLRASGSIQDDTLIWREGMANWQPYREVKGGATPPPAATATPGLRLAAAPAAAAETPEAVCVECGNMFPKENMIHYRNSWVCANCKPVFMQKLAEGARIETGELRYAGFWIRFAAKLLDGLIIGAVLAIPLIIFFMAVAVHPTNTAAPMHLEADHSYHAVGMSPLLGNLFGIFFQFFFVAANAIYAGFFVGKYGATPGKMACKLIVVDTNGAKVSYGRAFGRGFAEILSRMLCNLGYLMVAFDGQKRALHDHICSTRVVYK